jgi:hypothetical protein
MPNATEAPMKNIRYLFLMIFFFIACTTSAQQIKTARKPFQKSSVIIKSPNDYLHRDIDNGKSYDPKPRVVVIDEKAGKYELRWIGYDGKEKVIAYQRQDAIDAVVEAKVERTQDGKFLYKYLINVLPTSPTYFKEFIVQTLSGDAKPVKADKENFYIGDMFKAIQLFKEGVWWNYAYVGEKENTQIKGGQSIEFQLISAALPGIVGCKAAGGEITLKGVGEHMPYELESAMPGYEELASGYTIGPVESLASLSKPERAKYLLDNLPKFQAAGWMSDGTAKNYETLFKQEDLAGALEKAKKDLENEFITGEVFHIIEELNQ